MNVKTFLDYFNTLKGANETHIKSLLDNKKKVYTTGIDNNSTLFKNINDFIDNTMSRYNTTATKTDSNNNLNTNSLTEEQRNLLIKTLSKRFGK